VQYDLVSTREQLRILLFWKLLQTTYPYNAMPLRVNYTHAATRCYTKIYKTSSSKHSGADR